MRNKHRFTLFFLCAAWLLLLTACNKDGEEGDAPIQATVETLPRYEVVSQSTLKFSGKIAFGSSGNFDAHGFIWSDKNERPTLLDDQNNLGQISANATFSAEVSGLAYDKLYYFRSYAKKGDQVVLGEVFQASLGWRPRADFPGGTRRDGLIFTIGEKIYVGLGNATGPDAPTPKDLWEYDPQTDFWTQKASFPGLAREEPYSFVINGKLYVGGGMSLPGWNKDLYLYDPATDRWTQLDPKGDIPNPQPIIFGNGAFTLNGKGYVTLREKLYEYDPATNEWVFRARLPDPHPESFTALAFNGRGYILGGLKVANADAWEYDPFLLQWQAKASFPTGQRFEAIAFVWKNRIFFGTGATNSTFSTSVNDFWEFNPVANQWTRSSPMPGDRQGAFAAATPTRAFAGMGSKGTSKMLLDWWEFLGR